MTSMRRQALWVVVLLGACTAQAHEARPGYLELWERGTGHYDVFWKQPVAGELALRISPEFPSGCLLDHDESSDLLSDSLLTRFSVQCPWDLSGRTITIAGLELTLTDALVRFHHRNGTEETHLARSSAPSIQLGVSRGVTAGATAYLLLGIVHILAGIDHLLFVLGLLLLVRDRRMLLETVTAFTVAHSITLALATASHLVPPLEPLNAAIALSILFVGVEVLRSQRGADSLTLRHPWVVAFAFGLVHGFGFASGLIAAGMPHAGIALALLLFNVGVEIGQLGFILLLLALAAAFRQLQIRWPHPAEIFPAYLVGVLGAAWSIERIRLLFG